MLIFQCKKSLCLLSCNINGIADYQKRAKVIDHYLFPKTTKPKPDIFSFQETHSTPKTNGSFLKSFKNVGDIVMSHGVCNSKGVLLGFSKRLNTQIISSETDQDGRFVVAHVKIFNESLTVASMYLEPTLRKEQTLDILNQAMTAITKGGNSRVILCGDFNAVLKSLLGL